jgi:hypothetical protein
MTQLRSLLIKVVVIPLSYRSLGKPALEVIHQGLKLGQLALLESGITGVLLTVQWLMLFS